MLLVMGMSDAEKRLRVLWQKSCGHNPFSEVAELRVLRLYESG
jgi:hypothetical protein